MSKQRGALTVQQVHRQGYGEVWNSLQIKLNLHDPLSYHLHFVTCKPLQSVALKMFQQHEIDFLKKKLTIKGKLARKFQYLKNRELSLPFQHSLKKK